MGSLVLELLASIGPLLACVCAGAAVGVGAYGVHAAFLQPLTAELEDEPSLRTPFGLGQLLVRRLGAMNRRFISPKTIDRLSRQLVRAGEPNQLAPDELIALQELAALGGLLLGGFTVVAYGWSLLVAVVVAAAFAVYPRLWLRSRVNQRMLLISRALPYSIDLLTLAVEAGLDFTGALAKVVEKGRRGPLNDELALVLKHLKVGKTREESLRGLAERIELPALNSFVNALVQADRMGTSLGKVLRIQSVQLRTERTLLAEKKAAEAPVKLLFPLIFCIFPTILLIIFAPLVYAYFFGSLAG